ncbi:MAG: GNAT family N-acetyltransferase [Candidatus Bathyarchaeota archaeon]|nr:GNAT family N-acetyltransferase [Candidatus Bathyarchaeota archaeon]
MGVERAARREIEAILSVINISNREAYRDIIPQEHFREPVLTPEELLKLMEELTFYVYKDEGDAIGVAALRVGGEGTGRVDWVYVLPEHQRRGVGTSLMNHIEDEAVGMGLRKLTLAANEDATWACDFYSKLGYKRIGKIPRPWGDDVAFERDLN